MNYSYRKGIMRKGMMNKIKSNGICLCCILMLLAVTGAAAAEEYVIQADDVLKFSVYDHEEMNSTVRVGRDGVVILPLLDAVEVGGLTVSQATEENNRPAVQWLYHQSQGKYFHRNLTGAESCYSWPGA